jgi:hypothetical protein
MPSKAEKKAALKTFQSAIKKAISENGNLDFNDFVDLSYELENKIYKYQVVFRIKPTKDIPLTETDEPSNGHPGIYLLAH